MTKQEFIDRVVKLKGSIFNVDNDYPLIEYVYTWHPLISETKGKDQVAKLYVEFGIGIFKEMNAKAEKAEQIENEIIFHRNRLNEAKAKLEELKGGN